MDADEETGACHNCGEGPVVVRCASKGYCQRCGEWMASSRVERGWAALEMLDYAIGAMLRARFTRDEIERAVAFRIESGGSLENAVLADWQRIDPPSMSSVLGGRRAAAVPPDFEVLAHLQTNGSG